MAFGDILGMLSGTDAAADISERALFNSVIGVRGIVDGVGASTLVQSLAIALSERTSKSVCVVDTSILYPTQYELLCGNFSSDARASLKDWFSIETVINNRIIDTKYRRVSLLGCFNRRITDAFSATDTLQLATDTFKFLRDVFDVILVDLSHEWSQIAMASAMECNRIYTVVDLSPRCMANIQHSLNNLAISAVPFSKFQRTIVNKYTVKGVTGIKGVLEECRLDVIATIPFSEEIYTLSTLGRTPRTAATMSTEVAMYNAAVDTLVSEILNESQLEILDLQELEDFEKEVEEKGVKNKAKARKQLLKAREALLAPSSDEAKAAAKEARHERVKTRKSKAQAEIAELEAQGYSGEDDILDLGFNTETVAGREETKKDGDVL